MSNLLGKNWLAPANEANKLLGWSASGTSMCNYSRDDLRDLIGVDGAVYLPDYGSVADGVTDDGPAFNAALAYIRGLSGSRPALIVPAGDYYIGTSINMTDIRAGLTQGALQINAYGARLLGNCAGKPVIDCTRSQSIEFAGLAVIGDAVNTPLCAFQFARGNDSETADSMLLYSVNVKGNYTRAGVYNFASERFIAIKSIIRNYASGADKYGMIIDGQNYYGATSDYYTITVAQYTTQSCLNHAFISTTFGSGIAGSTGTAMQIIGASRINMVGCYAVARGGKPGVELGVYNANSSCQNLDLDLHMEPEGDISHCFYFKDLSGGVTTSSTYDNFVWKENSLHAGTAVFGSDLTGQVIIRHLNAVVSGTRPGAAAKIFDVVRFTVSGQVGWLINDVPTGLNIDYFTGQIFCPNFSAVTLPTGGTYDTVDYSGSTQPVTRYGSITHATNIYSNGPLIGYTTGAGGSVTQDTSKSTGVTLDKACGSIVTHNDNLVAGTTVRFTFTNSTITAGTALIVHRRTGGSASSYNIWVDSLATGSAEICVRNITAGDLAEAVTIRFMVFNVVTS